MGVKDVWHVAGPCEERISLHSLRGTVLAIDLAGWVVQGQSAPGLSNTVTRPHLRNLFFRLNTLLSLDIIPVVVLDGVCPLAKSATVQARNQARGLTIGPHPVVENSPKRQTRRQFAGVLRDCQAMTESLGVPCLTAPGEAEAYCSWLNKAGLVDAVVSDDSDCFGYGACTVLRHFSADPKQFSVSRYSAERIRKELAISRQRLVIMALILGCDYNPGGVCGVGREALLRLFSMWGEPRKDELDRVMAWEAGREGEDEGDKKPIHCGTCGHPGSVGKHRKVGCEVCGTGGGCRSGQGDCPCDYHSDENQLLLAEGAVRRKAVASPGWPPGQVVREFYRDVPTLSGTKFMWKRPKPGDFLAMAVRKMDWLQDYSVEKVVDTVVRWQVRNCQAPAPLVAPQRVVKKRVRAGENMLEVEWTSCQSSSLPTSIVACVPSTEFSEAYPQIYQQYLEALEAKAAGKRKPSKKKKDKENDPPKEKKEKAVKREQKDQPKIDKFLNKENIVACEKEIESHCISKPKNIVFKKLVSKDMKFNNKIFEHKFVTPKENEKFVDEVEANKDKVTDSYASKSDDEFRPKICHLEVDVDPPSGDIMTASMRQYLDSDDELDLSDIVNDIVGVKKKPANNVLNLMDKLTNLSIDGPCTSTPGVGRVKSAGLMKTSTPAFVGTDSPALKNTKPHAKKVKASNVFDFDVDSPALRNNKPVKEVKDSDACNFEFSDGSFIIDPEPDKEDRMKKRVLENLVIINEPTNTNDDTYEMVSVTNTSNKIFRKNDSTIDMDISKNEPCNNDTFDMDTSSNTPFAERARRRMNQDLNS